MAHKKSRGTKKAATVDGTPASLRVRATADGFYGAGEQGARIRKGQRFTLNDPKDFSDKWMEYVSENEPDDVEQQRQAASSRPTRRRPIPVHQTRKSATPPSAAKASEPTGDRDVLESETE
jgi:hypothetical protein